MSVGEKNNEGKRERQFSQEQYDILVRCSEKKDMTEWNEWLEKYSHVKILLEDTNLMSAHLKGAKLREANLEGACLSLAHLEGSDLQSANLKDANLIVANLEGANLVGAQLKGANLSSANLAGAGLEGANLEGSDLSLAHLEGADFEAAIVNGETFIWDPSYNRKTSFYGVGLRSARVEPGLRADLEAYNRRFKWEKWYKENRKRNNIFNPIVPFIKAFWWMSDYGKSAPKVIGTFFGLAVIFAVLYCIPGLVDGLYTTGEVIQVAVPRWVIPFRALYFSIITMTTLGFGDIVANPTGILGHILLTIQVLLGYVMLAALLSRLAVLFQEG